MTEKIDELRQKAKDLGIRNWHNKTLANLQVEILEVLEEKSKPTDELVPKKEVVKPSTINPDITTHKHYFTDPDTHRIGEYILTDARNPIKPGKKGSAYQFVRWV